MARLLACAALWLAAAAEEDESTDESTVEAPVVGIDLGTTFSVVAVWQDGEIVIIPNEFGNRIDECKWRSNGVGIYCKHYRGKLHGSSK